MKISNLTINEDPLSFLFKYDLVRGQDITNAAYLLFKNKVSALTTIELGRFQDEITIKDSSRTKEDVLKQIEQVLDFVKKHINREVIITGEARNIQKWQYPLNAIREIVTNLIVHRVCRLSSDSIVKIFDDRIEFFNPGRLPKNITVDDLLNNRYRSTPRNKLIADLCKDIGLIGKYGSGIQRVINNFIDAGLPVLLFQNISVGFMVTVYSEKVGERLSVNQRKIIELMTKDAYVTARELSEMLGISVRKIETNISY
ncbi:ATP-binding protein [Alkalitalea saponilacus]|nr:ATP-binding protein [Alkalitalea saponilacus]